MPAGVAHFSTGKPQTHTHTHTHMRAHSNRTYRQAILSFFTHTTGSSMASWREGVCRPWRAMPEASLFYTKAVPSHRTRTPPWHRQRSSGTHQSFSTTPILCHLRPRIPCHLLSVTWRKNQKNFGKKNSHPDFFSPDSLPHGDDLVCASASLQLHIYFTLCRGSIPDRQ